MLLHEASPSTVHHMAGTWTCLPNIDLNKTDEWDTTALDSDIKQAQRGSVPLCPLLSIPVYRYSSDMRFIIF